VSVDLAKRVQVHAVTRGQHRALCIDGITNEAMRNKLNAFGYGSATIPLRDNNFLTPSTSRRTTPRSRRPAWRRRNPEGHDGSTRASLIVKDLGIKFERRASFADPAKGLGYCACSR